MDEIIQLKPLHRYSRGKKLIKYRKHLEDHHVEGDSIILEAFKHIKLILKKNSDITGITKTR